MADLLGADPAGTAVVGESGHGSRSAHNSAVRLLAGSGQVVTQLRVPGKTNEITFFAALLASTTWPG